MFSVDRRYMKYFDWISLFLTIILCSIGLLFVYSATTTSLCPYSVYFQKQLFGMISGFTLYFLFCFIDYRLLCRIGYFMYFLVILLLLFTLIKGKIGMGAQRWIDLKIVKFQPSEVAKLFFPAFITYYLYSENDVPLYTMNSFLPIIGILCCSTLLVLKQPDLGTAIVLFVSGIIMLWFAGIGKKFFYWGIFFSLLVAPAGWHFLKPYQKQRIMVFLGEGNARKERYQIEQSKIAIGSGSITGKGLGNGTQNKLQFLPEARTDFIFSVISEEWGFVGAIGILIIYLLLIIRIIRKLDKAKTFFGQLLGIGLLIPFGLAIIINTGMVCGLLPIVGIPLPLMSYGVTALWITLASLGWIQGIILKRF